MTSAIYQELSERAAVIYEKVVMWRRDFHRYPELAGHEERTSGLVAEHLRALGLEGADLSKVVAGYEPIWAIGPGKTPASARIWTRYPYRSRRVFPMHPRFRASCTRAVTTRIRRCSWERLRCSARCARSCAAR